MAQVDFSNAKIEYMSVAQNEWSRPYFSVSYNTAVCDSSGNIISTDYGRNKMSETTSKVSFLFYGKLTTSGTEFYLISYFNVRPKGAWKISNISFNANDMYAFIIDMEVIVE